jgi:FGGY-family pentulose kinase
VRYGRRADRPLGIGTLSRGTEHSGSEPPYVFGVDIGTQSLRAGLFDLAGNPLVFASQEYPVRHPMPGWAEQSPVDWWDALVGAVGRCVRDADVHPSEIVALSLDNASCTVAAIDEEGQPLRPALLWMDVRAHDQARRVTSTEDPILRYVGDIESPEWMIPKAMWIKENEPDIYRRADKIVESIDWLNYKLTGRWVGCLNNVTCKWNYATPLGGWSGALLRDLDMEDLAVKWPAEVLPVAAPLAPLLPSVAKELGLGPDTLVVQGAIDAYAGMIGVNSLRPGRLALITGSSTCHLAVSEEALFDSMAWGPYPDAVVPGLWILEGGQVSTGSIVRWFAEQFGPPDRATGSQEEGISYGVLDGEAANVPPGSEGLVLLDYWQGNRSPLRDPLARGAIWGLTLRHTRSHVFRAIYEGTAYGTRHILEDLAGAGFLCSEMYACGGGTKSQLWMQIHADVCQLPIFITEVQEAMTLGSAICAAVGSGQYSSLTEAADNMVRIKTIVDPDPSEREVYDFYFQQYVATYPQLRHLMHKVSARTEEQG